MKQSAGSNLADIINKHEQEHQEQMKDIIKPVELKTFKAYPIIIAVMAVLQMMSMIYGRKFVIFLGFNVAVNSIVFVPMILYVFQIVSECYGWQYGRQIVWCNFVFNGLATAILFGMKFVVSSSFTHEDLAFSYNHFVDTLWVSAMLNWLLIFLADYLCSVLMNYTKNIYKGYFLLIRMLLVHLLSEVVLCVGSLIALPYNGYSIDQTIHVVYQTFIARMVACAVISPFATFAVLFIQKRVEKVVAFDNSRNFWNIFHWSIQDKNTVSFDYEQWNRLSAERKKRVDINKIALDYYTDEKLGIDKIFKNRSK
jgi:hypothetical protein